jgi:hypothetical protein
MGQTVGDEEGTGKESGRPLLAISPRDSSDDIMLVVLRVVGGTAEGTWRGGVERKKGSSTILSPFL